MEIMTELIFWHDYCISSSGAGTNSQLMDLQVRGFWLGPWLKNEAVDTQKVFADLMGYLADGTLRPDSGPPPPSTN